MNSLVSTTLFVLFSFTTIYSTGAEQFVLLDTRTATTELNWRSWSNQHDRDGWLEETTYSEEQKVNHRIFSTCDVGHTDIENWLLVPAVSPHGEAARLYMEISYNIAKCEKLLVLSKRQLAACRETMNLYGLTLRDNEQLNSNWFNDTKWNYLETLVIKSERESDTRHVLTIAYPVNGPLTSSRVHFALKNTGACAAVLYIKLYYNFCPPTSQAFASLPRTLPAGGDLASVVTVVGRCVPNASPSLDLDSTANNLSSRSQIVAHPPTFICRADGTWQSVGASHCECNPGFVAALKANACTGRNAAGVDKQLKTPSVVVEERSAAGDGPHIRHRRPSAGSSSSSFASSVSSLADNSSAGGMADGWLRGLLAVRDYWLWIIVCVVSMLVICYVLLAFNRRSALGYKPSIDMEALDNYKVIPSVLPANFPLISPYSTMPRSNLPMGVKMLNDNRFRPYVDPTTYEDPRSALDEYTNEIDASAVEVTRSIGAGEFGEVCIGRLTIVDDYRQQHEHVVAVKTLLPGSSKKAKSDFLIEALIMGQFEHANVIRLLGVVTKSEPMMILTEYMMNGSLDSFLKANDNKIETLQLVRMLHGIACGMKYLTDRGYVHRDLAARNVLVDDRLMCKIADFGLSRGLTGPGEQEYVTKTGEKIPIRWTAPEAIAHSKYTAASDVWSFGVVMWEVMSFGDRPYGNWANHNVIEEVRAGYRLDAPPKTPRPLAELMARCWEMERHERPAFGQLVEALNGYLNDELYFMQRSPGVTRYMNAAYSGGGGGTVPGGSR